MPSVAEQILTRVHAVLIAAAIVTDDRLSRSREDAWGEDELPAINIVRLSTEEQGHSERLDRHLLSFDVQHLVASATWETAADALHMQTHAALMADQQLQSLGRGLRCTGTELLGTSADVQTARLVAHYQIHFITRPGDLTRAIT